MSLDSVRFSTGTTMADGAGAARFAAASAGDLIRRPPTQFRAKGPYTIAVVDLDAGVRLTGRLASVSENIKPGADVAFVGMDDATYLFEERAA